VEYVESSSDEEETLVDVSNTKDNDKRKRVKKNKSSEEQKTGPSFIGHIEQEKLFEKESPLEKLDLKVEKKKKKKKKKKKFLIRDYGSNISLYLVVDTQLDKSVT
jgi:hypothetical protein